MTVNKPWFMSFDDIFKDFNGIEFHKSVVERKVTSVNDEDGFSISYEVPGVKEQNIEVLLEVDGSLIITVSGKKHKKETVWLPSDVDKNTCSAELEDGILTVTFKKHNQLDRSSKKIEIKKL